MRGFSRYPFQMKDYHKIQEYAIFEVMKREFTAIYKKSGKWFLAWVEEIPGINTQGKTLKEAKENLKEALSLILETNKGIMFGRVPDAKRESISIKLSV